MTIRVEVKDKFNADLPEPKHGEHFWTWLVVFQCNDPRNPGTVMLDRENLVTIKGPGCIHCEEEYSERIALRRCKPV